MGNVVRNRRNWKMVTKILIALFICASLLILLYSSIDNAVTPSETINDGFQDSLFILFLSIAGVFAFSFIKTRNIGEMQDEITESDKQSKEQSEKIKELNEKMALLANKVTRLRSDGKTPPPAKDNTEPWNNIQKGMEQDKVIHHLGQPTAILPTANGEVYVYGENRLAGKISFVGGKLTYFTKPGTDHNLVITFDEPLKSDSD
jgi:hypothetical protein